jgi:hypothetical protein
MKTKKPKHSNIESMIVCPVIEIWNGGNNPNLQLKEDLGMEHNDPLPYIETPKNLITVWTKARNQSCQKTD